MHSQSQTSVQLTLVLTTEVKSSSMSSSSSTAGLLTVALAHLGIAVDSFPMKITVVSEALDAALNSMSLNRAPSVGATSSLDVPHTAASHFKSADCSQNG